MDLTDLTSPTLHASTKTSPSHPPCTPTTTPDSNGWVPPGTCGFLSRPYYPSFTTAVVFCFIAATIVACYLRRIHHTFHLRKDHAQVSTEKVASWKTHLLITCFGTLTATCLLTAYILRALGTRNMQVPAFVAGSDTLVLTCPILSSTLAALLLSHLSSTTPNPPLSHRSLKHTLLYPLLPLSLLALLSALLIAPWRHPTPTLSAAPTAMLGIKLYLLALAVHSALLLPTTIVAVVLYRRTSTVSLSTGCKRKRAAAALIIALLSLNIRTTYRLIELSALFTSTSWAAQLSRHEVYFYALECLPVLVSVGVWAVVDLQDCFEGNSGRCGYEEVRGEDGDEDGDEGVVLKIVDSG